MVVDAYAATPRSTIGDGHAPRLSSSPPPSLSLSERLRARAPRRSGGTRLAADAPGPPPHVDRFAPRRGPASCDDVRALRGAAVAPGRAAPRAAPPASPRRSSPRPASRWVRRDSPTKTRFIKGLYLSRRARRRGARGVCSDESEATTQKEPANAKAPPRLRLPIMRRRSAAAAPVSARIAASPSLAQSKAASSDVLGSAMRAPTRHQGRSRGSRSKNRD